MDHWSATRNVVTRDELLLTLQSIIPLKPAQSGIFYLQGNGMQGFQQGSTSPHQDYLALYMLAHDGSIEMMIVRQGSPSRKSIASYRVSTRSQNKVLRLRRQRLRSSRATTLETSPARPCGE